MQLVVAEADPGIFFWGGGQTKVPNPLDPPLRSCNTGKCHTNKSVTQPYYMVKLYNYGETI